ncbi:MAG: PfkB family carbohydrate kinase [bacterium]
MIALERARELVAAFARQRILVVGDLMLDQYLYGSVERISPEAPVPVVRVRREKRMPGGAANVAVNLRALGGGAALAGTVGDDSAGEELRGLLAGQEIGADAVLTDRNAPTSVKMRVVAERQQVCRVDWEPGVKLSDAVVEEFCARVRVAVAASTGVVIEDYGKGVVGQRVVDVVIEAAARAGIPVGLDPKENEALRFNSLTLATPNCREAHICAGLPPRNAIAGDPLQDATLRRVGELLLAKWNLAQLIITLGAQGMYLAASGVAPMLIPTRAREVFDVSGAGDTVIATCILVLAAGGTPLEAVALGNDAAGVVVGKLGTASCTPDELLQAVVRDAG